MFFFGYMTHIASHIAPTVVVVLGATGDLMKKKIVPAFFKLYKEGNLPPLFRLIGFSRRDLGDDGFREHVRHIVLDTFKDESTNSAMLKSFLEKITYQRGHLENNADYKELASSLGRVDNAWNACSNKLFYLAVPPASYEAILHHLSSYGLTEPCSDETGWTKVLVEKPFGKDLASSEMLDKLLSSLFKEEQIYRIDHYLGKDMLQNILQFRFANNLFEDSWSRASVEKVDIRLFEKIGVEQRGGFYDGVGAFRDVGQNHLLQMLALIAMDKPAFFGADPIREKRAQVLEELVPYSAREVASQTFRAQYHGYTSITGVAPDSQTETYFKIRAYLSGKRWKGVPFTLESGKRMGEALKEIVVTFKHPVPCLCPPDKHVNNKIVFRLEPKEEILVALYAKKPGLKNEVEEKDIRFIYRENTQGVQYVDAYEKLLFDAIIGDQTLFASSREIAAMWHFTDPIVESWAKNSVPLVQYEPDTATIADEAKLLDKHVYNNRMIAHRSVGIVGLGKMGSGIALQLKDKGWSVYGYNRTQSVTDDLTLQGIQGCKSIADLVAHMPTPRIVWLMLPAGEVTDGALKELISLLSSNDIVVDGANSYYKDSVRRNELLKPYGIRFLDIGVSGGPAGARSGACVMVGGEREDYLDLLPLLEDIAAPEAIGYFGLSGAGHFAKMIHNGIEYGMMESIAEGAAVLKASEYNFDMSEVFRIYNHASVIESRLVGWTHEALQEDPHLSSISSHIHASGEGEWTVKTAKELGVMVPVIEDSLRVRQDSSNVKEGSHEAFRNKVVSAQRGKFGHHDVAKK